MGRDSINPNLHLVLEMGQVLVLELKSTEIIIVYNLMKKKYFNFDFSLSWVQKYKTKVTVFTLNMLYESPCPRPSP